MRNSGFMVLAIAATPVLLFWILGLADVLIGRKILSESACKTQAPIVSQYLLGFCAWGANVPAKGASLEPSKVELQDIEPDDGFAENAIDAAIDATLGEICVSAADVERIGQKFGQWEPHVLSSGCVDRDSLIALFSLAENE